MKKLLYICIMLVCLFCSNLIKINAYNVSSGNNPGSTYNDGGDNGVSGNTYWPVNEDGKSLRAVRIRIFRGNIEIKSAYYSLAESSNKCFSSVSNVSLCETSSYNYASVLDSVGTTCTSNKNVSLGCIVSNNLLSTWGVKSSNGKYLDDYLKNNNYTNLKSILADMGYNDTNFDNSDVVIIEPVTLVKCNGVNYFGTSTAMMKKNVSYNGVNGNICFDSSNSNSDKYPGGNFINLFKSMSVALKISTKTSYQGDSNYSGFGFFKYNVSGFGYIPQNGKIDVKIIVKNSTPEKLITSSNATFEIYSGANCSGEVIDTVITSSGVASRGSLPAGTYSVKEKVGPEGYSSLTEKCVAKNVTIAANDTKTVKVFYEPKCETSLSESDKSVASLLELYNKYGINGLLNFSNPSCKPIDCERKKLESLGCLSASTKYTYDNFSENNLSCFDQLINVSDSAGFCQTTFELNNNLGTNKFYGLAGSFLIKQTSYDSPITIYDNNLNPTTVSNTVATSKLRKTCYIYNKKSYGGYNTLPVSNVSFGDNDLNKVADTLQVNTVTSENISGIDVGVFKKTVYEVTNTYNLNPVYLEKISGKYFSTPSPNTLPLPIYGVLSKFNESKGSILFSVSYNGVSYSSNSCEFETNRKLIPPNGGIALEFRIVDSKDPFNRKTNYNWSDGDDNSQNNKIVEKYILNRNNSYNSTGDGPKYKIILTPDDIKIIRKYNLENAYDNYEMYCDNINNCRNAFVHDLLSGSLNKYKLSGNLSVIEKTYGIFSSQMEFKDS